MGRNRKIARLVKGKPVTGHGKKKSKTPMAGEIPPYSWSLMRKQKALRKKIQALDKNSKE